MKYTVLNKNIFVKDQYEILPIRFDDMEAIRNWRNAQMKVLRQNNILSVKNQSDYFNNVVSKLFDQENPSQLLFSFLKEKKLIGYGGLVNISWVDLRAEMSFLVDNNRALDNVTYKEDMSYFVDLIKQLVFEEINFNRLFTETYDFRKFHIEILESNGFQKEGVLRQQVLIENKFHDSLMHSVLKQDYEGI